ncbi:MAG TPA: hypothetical protein ENK25_03010 [Bacteroidetes bacterium]|nr:hypothetical protein [Bacteroidota bacterium]
MKKLFSYSSLLLGALVVIIIINPGCKKEKSVSNKALLTAHPWNYVKAETTSTDSTIINGVALANALMTGAVMTFKDDGTYTLTAMNQTQKGTWKLSTDEKIITIDNGDPETIVTLTDTEFVLKEDMTDSHGNPYSTSIFWRK